MPDTEGVINLREAAIELRISPQALGQIVRRLGISSQRMIGNSKGISAQDRRRIHEFFESHNRKEMAS